MLLKDEIQHITLDMIAYLFVPQRDDDISFFVTYKRVRMANPQSGTFGFSLPQAKP